MSFPDLEEAIVSSIEDAEIGPDPDTSEESPVESQDAPGTAQDAPESTTAPTQEEAPTSEVKSPGAKSKDSLDKDDFEKKYGIPKESSSGRENRIPYSRVKKIVEKQTKELEASYTPRIAEFEAKVKDYEGRLSQVAQFEKVMVNEPQKFLTMLATLPQYKALFEAQAPSQAQPEATPPVDDMPAPDQTLTDGTQVYSMEGLKSLLAWNAKQVENRVTEQVQKRYAPIESEWQAHQQVQRLIPQVQAQINDARTWPQFSENEAEIVKVLQSDQNISLERAYQKVVFPKMAANRDTMRADILKELKKAPTSTSAPSSASKPGVSPSGPRSLEDVISESIKALR